MEELRKILTVELMKKHLEPKWILKTINMMTTEFQKQMMIKWLSNQEEITENQLQQQIQIILEET